MKRTIGLVLVLMAAGGAPASADHAFDPNCGRGGEPIEARFLQPENGKLVVETQAGSQNLSGTPLPNGLMLSTTGEITVEISHSCIAHLELTVLKGTEVIHENAFTTACGQGTVTDSVEIGLDAGEFTFELDGIGCNKNPIKRSSEGHYVGDPPLPLL